MKISGIIFDIDGTLLDSMKIWHTCANLYLEKIGRFEKRDLGEEFMKMTIVTASQFLKKNYDIEMSEAEIQKGILDLIRDFYETKVQLKTGVREFLEECKNRGIKMAVASSGEKELIKPAFERLDISKYFEAVCTGDKNTGEIFENAAKILNVPKNEIVVFEDAVHAIRSAKESGFTVAAMYDEESEYASKEIKELADYYFKDWSEVCLLH